MRAHQINAGLLGVKTIDFIFLGVQEYRSSGVQTIV
jgi:hypothetical protein